MNRRRMKKQILRQLAHLLSTRNQDWRSVPNWWAETEGLCFRDPAHPTEAEERRFDHARHEVLMDLYARGGIRV